jgi:magnesium-protoporphyrin O-methyltransferase
MEAASYDSRRRELEEYFDRTAVDAWARLTSDAPVSRVRATVRAGRDRMRATLLGYLPDDMRGMRLLDAGCGTGALAVEAAARGADVLAIDLSQTLVGLARSRMPARVGGGRVEFRVSDMLDPTLGRFDWVVAMDSLIHYAAPDMTEMIARLCARADCGMAFSFAPSTPLLRVMWVMGKAFPKSDRSPALEPIGERSLRKRIAEHPEMGAIRVGGSARIDSAFYISHAMQLVRS